MQNTTGSRRSGGRSARVVAAVRAATAELIRERGPESVTVPMIAERAGVNPTSIYRRWGDLPTLINDVATYRPDPASPLPDTGKLCRDLTAWAAGIVEYYQNPANAAVLRGGAAAAGQDASDCLRDRLAEAGALAQRDDAQGLTADDVVDHVLAPIVYRAIFLPRTLNDSIAAALVASLYDARPPAPARR